MLINEFTYKGLHIKDIIDLHTRIQTPSQYIVLFLYTHSMPRPVNVFVFYECECVLILRSVIKEKKEATATSRLKKFTKNCF